MTPDGGNVIGDDSRSGGWTVAGCDGRRWHYDGGIVFGGKCEKSGTLVGQGSACNWVAGHISTLRIHVAGEMLRNTSYGPSHLGRNFPTSSALLASLLWSRLISKASSFYTISTSAVFCVGMPISVGITASVPYVSEKGVSPLLDLIMMRCAHRTTFRERSSYVNSPFVEWPWGRDWGQLLLQISRDRTPLITANRCELRRTALALFTSAGRVSFVRYRIMSASFAM
ncbi:hypothetical protein Tco_1294406 [Tanacetum coccineum]